MDPFTYSPSPIEIEQLVRLQAHEGWAIFTRIMQESYNQTGALAIEEMDTPQARPTGYYKGYMDSIRATIERVDYLIKQLTEERQETNEAERFSPARPYASSGDTAS